MLTREVPTEKQVGAIWVFRAAAKIQRKIAVLVKC